MLTGKESRWAYDALQEAVTYIEAVDPRQESPTLCNALDLVQEVLVLLRETIEEEPIIEELDFGDKDYE